MTWTKIDRPDLAERVVRRKLRPRRGRPYWELLEYGRAIGLEKHSKVNSFWMARYRTKDGKYKRRRLARADGQQKANGVDILTYEQAVDCANAWFSDPIQARQASKSFPIGPRTKLDYQPPLSGPFTVGQALVDYFEWKQLVSTESSFLSLLSTVNLLIVPRLAHLPAEGVNGEIVRHFVRIILELPAKRGAQPQLPPRPLESIDEETLRKRKKTVNKLMSVLRGSLEMAWENGKIDNERAWRCCKHIPTVERPRVLHLSRNECKALLAVSEPDLRRLILGALYTGCRATELLRMRVSHVGRDGYGVYVTPVKTYKPRFVFLPDEGMVFFLELIKGKPPGTLTFLRDNGTQWRETLRHVFKRAVRRAVLPEEFTFHGLRHTYASQLVQSGAPLVVIADQLGHANTQTVCKTYGHLSPQIRESEVGQRFTSIDDRLACKARRQAKSLKAWRDSLHGADWRTYATIHDLKSCENTRH